MTIRPEFDPRHWRFERNSGLPIGYFPRRLPWHRRPWVVLSVATVVAAFLAGVLLAFTVKG